MTILKTISWIAGAVVVMGAAKIVGSLVAGAVIRGPDPVVASAAAPTVSPTAAPLVTKSMTAPAAAQQPGTQVIELAKGNATLEFDSWQSATTPTGEPIVAVNMRYLAKGETVDEFFIVSVSKPDCMTRGGTVGMQHLGNSNAVFTEAGRPPATIEAWVAGDPLVEAICAAAFAQNKF
jgi:hypothetical protein